MDLTSRYRTKLPPREHQETVRMLMRSIGATDLGEPTTTQSRRFMDATGRGASKVSAHRSPAKYHSGPTMVSEVDKSSLHSTATSYRKPAPSAEVCSTNSSTEYESHPNTDRLTSSLSRVSTDLLEVEPRAQQDIPEEEKECTGERIPSRTIAIQCELKTSSTLGKRQDNSMHASSISSTRYGFYNYSVETLAQRRKLQRSISNWNIAEAQPSNSGDSDSDFEVRQATRNGFHRKSLKNNDDEEEEGEEEEEEEEEEADSSTTRPSAVSVEKSAGRGRVYSITRRPTTALSYVSNSRLKDTRDYDRDLSSQPMRQQARAMSHMNLSGPRTPVEQRELSSASCSECELGSRTNSSGSRKSSGLTDARAASRPTLVSSSRNEHVRGYKTLERLPVSRRNLPEQDSDYLDNLSAGSGLLGSGQAGDERRQRTVRQVLKQLENAETGRPQHRAKEEQERINSMSLNRRTKPIRATSDSTWYNSADPTSGYCTAKRVPRRASTLAAKKKQEGRFSANDYLSERTAAWSSSGGSNQVEPSTATDRYDSGLYDSASSGNQSYAHTQQQQQPVEHSRRRSNLSSQRLVDEFDYELKKGRTCSGANRESDEESDCSFSKTWANPSLRPGSARGQVPESHEELRKGRYKSGTTRSHSMRDINAESDRSYMQECCMDYYKKQVPLRRQQEKQQTAGQHGNHLRRDYESSPESSLLDGDLQRDYLKSRAVNYDSQHRLNEIGLPEVDRSSATLNYGARGSSSHLGLNSARVYQPTRRLQRSPTQIAGRALSQQQLIRPSMPSSRRRRTYYSTGNSASDAGGSSISLAGNRLTGSRHELAYTRTPVVMYIPQVGSDLGRSGATSSGHEEDLLSIGRGSRLRRTLRSRQVSRQVAGSQDISLGSRGRSVSRNGSDSESSSMLRTLIRSKGSKSSAQQLQTKQRLVSRQQLHRQPLDENHANHDQEDHIGQLVSELDSGKFKRRYSVPRNAKINWFSKLRQRVSSSVKS